MNKIMEGQSKGMKKLIILMILNFVAAGLPIAIILASWMVELFIFMLTSKNVILNLDFLLIARITAITFAVVNIAAIFVFWKQHRFRAFLPIITFILLSASFWFFVFKLPQRLVGLPSIQSDPNLFLTEPNRTELEGIAGRLLGQSFKEVCTFPDKPTEIYMISGYPQKEMPSDIIETLRHYGFMRTFIDDSQSLVVFSCYHQRIVYEYLYSTKEFLPLYIRPASITEVDMSEWSELIRIAKQGDSATKKEREGIVFSPSVVYPYLEQELGAEFLRRVATYTSSGQFSAEDKKLVLSALNRQRLTSSRLIENPWVTFKINNDWDAEINLNEFGIGADFWVVSLVKNLLDEGVLVYAQDGRHLKIKEDLTPTEQCKIEWLHIGLMNFLYGNLMNKREYHYDRDLGNGWYFNRWK